MSNKTEHDLYLGLGANLGDRENNLKLALSAIEQRIGKVISLSAFFVTKPVGFTSENLFLNAACHVKTKLNPLEILDQTQSIEKTLGRNAKSIEGVYVDRLIDIDVLILDDVVCQYPDLVIPHPDLHRRDFVLSPLSEIAKNVLHPIFKRTIGELEQQLIIGHHVK